MDARWRSRATMHPLTKATTTSAAPSHVAATCWWEEEPDEPSHVASVGASSKMKPESAAPRTLASCVAAALTLELQRDRVEQRLLGVALSERERKEAVLIIEVGEGERSRHASGERQQKLTSAPA
eukprot:3422154-Prymnesium_polylepis.2